MDTDAGNSRCDADNGESCEVGTKFKTENSLETAPTESIYAYQKKSIGHRCPYPSFTAKIQNVEGAKCVI